MYHCECPSSVSVNQRVGRVIPPTLAAAAVARHLAALGEVDPDLAQAYRVNSLRTARRAHAPGEVFEVLGR